MKRIIIACLLAACCARGDWTIGVTGGNIDVTDGVIQAWSPLNYGPVAWYRADDTALDSSGTNDAAWLGTSLYTTGYTGLSGDSSFLLSSNRALTCGNPVDLQITNGLTVAAWVYPTGIGGSFTDGIFTKFATTGTQRGYTLERMVAAPYALRAFVSFNGESAGDVSATVMGSAIPADSWQHVVMVFRPSASIEAWQNGAQTASNDVAFANIHNSTASADIGQVQATASRRFVGRIDEVMVFDRALSAAEIKQLYNWRQ